MASSPRRRATIHPVRLSTATSVRINGAAPQSTYAGAVRIALLRDDGDFDPDALVAGLDESIERPRPNVGGFHIFTFNDLESTERWRQQVLERLQPA